MGTVKYSLHRDHLLSMVSASCSEQVRPMVASCLGVGLDSLLLLLWPVAVSCCSVIDQEEWEGKIIAAGPATVQTDHTPKEFPIIGGSGVSHS